MTTNLINEKLLYENKTDKKPVLRVTPVGGKTSDGEDIELATEQTLMLSMQELNGNLLSLSNQLETLNRFLSDITDNDLENC